MYEDKKFLTAREILEKDFKIDARGYRPQEVDQFLDLIIKDYIDFETIYKNAEIYKVELNMLNSLIGSKNIEKEL